MGIEGTDIAERQNSFNECALGTITHPLFDEADSRGSYSIQARMPVITAKGFAPLSLAVSTVVRTSASASAAHMAR
jgi:hypothetical protein